MEFVKTANRKKIIAIIFSVILLGTFLLSAVFLAEEIGHHDCIGDDCPICETIEQCVYNLTVVGMAVLFIAVCVSIKAFISHIIKTLLMSGYSLSPVEYKVRLNN